MNKKRIAYTIIVSFIVVFSTTFAILMTLERRDYKNYLQGEYTKSMYQLIDSVKNLKGSLAKSAIVNSDRKSTRLNSSHANISYAVFCLKKKKIKIFLIS